MHLGALFRDHTVRSVSVTVVTDLVSFHTDDDGESDWSELTWRGDYYRGGKGGFAEPDSSHVPDGETAVVGDVDRDGYDDVVTGAPGSGAGDAKSGAGTVLYLRRGSGGLTGGGARLFGQSDLKARPETQDRFGAAVRLTDTDGDRKADLAGGSAVGGKRPRRRSLQSRRLDGARQPRRPEAGGRRGIPPGRLRPGGGGLALVR